MLPFDWSLVRPKLAISSGRLLPALQSCCRQRQQDGASGRCFSLGCRDLLGMGHDLPSPGQLVVHDCRQQQQRASGTARPRRLLQVDCLNRPAKSVCQQGQTPEASASLQWNIERGYKLPGIIAELRDINADIIALQEVDIGCERSGRADVGERDPHCIPSSHQHRTMLWNKANDTTGYMEILPSGP